MAKYPVLTVKQPWAWAILAGAKRVENRSQRTNFRGRILIQAGKALDALGPGRDLLRAAGCDPPGDRELARGVIAGSVEIVDCVRVDELPAALAGDPLACGP